MCTERRRPLSVLLWCGALETLAACNGNTSYLDASGTAGHEEAILGRWLTAVSLGVVAMVCAVILLGIARHRGPHNTREDGGATGATVRREVRPALSWIYVGTAATFVILLVTFAGTLVTLQAASRPPRKPTITMDVTAHQWWWEIRYRDASHSDFSFVTANEVHLPVGEPVRVRLQTADVIHSFWLPQIAGKTDVIPGQVNEMWVEAKQPGSSRGMCGEYCGLQHAMMSLAVTAESPDDFRRWAEDRRAEAKAPQTPMAAAGRVVFTRSCGACHAVGGTMALGRLGPDLTHIASRPWIGAGLLPNNPGSLMQWITNAPAVKEGARMPPIRLSAGELRDVIAYLQTLR
jgi:cytochrome c oxidase subunit 2